VKCIWYDEDYKEEISEVVVMIETGVAPETGGLNAQKHSFVETLYMTLTHQGKMIKEVQDKINEVKH